MGVVRRDRAYHLRSHGGVTLSGGEPLLQPSSSLLDLLSQLKSDGFHVAVETAGHVRSSVFESVLPFIDLFLFDLKVVGDDDAHFALTGTHDRLIAENARRLIAAKANGEFRMCVVPGHNDSDRNFRATSDFLRALDRPSISLLRYYAMHEGKARRLGLAQAPLNITAAASADAIERAATTFAAAGIAVSRTAPYAAPRSPDFTPRVHAIRKDIRDAGYAVCMETAILKTDFHKRHGFTKPVGLQCANLLRHLLNNKKVIVYPHELLVGNYTSKRVGGNMWVEYFGPAGAISIWNADRQKPVSFKCSLEDKLTFYLKLLPYWAKHSLIGKVFPSTRELALFAARMLEKRVAFHNNMAGVAHYIVNTERIVQLGTTGIRAEVEAKRADKPRDETAAFYESVLIALCALEDFALRYATHLRDLGGRESDGSRRTELFAMADVCERVPRHPARTFHEALQSILFFHIALCTESFENAISFGRLDTVLYPYYQRDVAAGVLNYEKAKELVACFILKIDEVIFVNDGDTGFQLGKLFESLSPVETVTVGGVDEAGKDATNDVSYMVLDVCELRPIGVNMAARIHQGSPNRYVERIAEVYRNGSPMPALFNDEPYIKALQNEYTTSLSDARNYSIVGCVEPVASRDHFANTDCANINVTWPFLQALKGDERPLWKYGLLERPGKKLIRYVKSKLARNGAEATAAAAATLGDPRAYAPPANMDELMARFRARMNELVSSVLADHYLIEAALRENLATPLASALFTGCIEKGKGVFDGGATYNSSGIQAVGITDVADSLAAIDDVVFTKKLHTIDEVIRAIDANFTGDANQRIREVLRAAPKFGDDAAPETAAWMNRVLEIYVNALAAVKRNTRGGKYVAGYYGLNVNLVYGKKTPALPSGRLHGVPLANSLCPHYGMQQIDLTSSLNAVSHVDFGRFAPNGTTLTSTIDAGLFPGDDGIRNLASLIRGYFDRGGMQFQPNIVSREILLDAYNNPGKYKDLVVRIAGYCGYFDDLSNDLKLEIINRTYYSGGPSA
jgi:formate C-acetyltransferase